MRICETWTRTVCRAVGGGRAPQSSSIRRSPETAWSWWSSRIASVARRLSAPKVDGATGVEYLKRTEDPKLHSQPPGATLAPGGPGITATAFIRPLSRRSMLVGDKQRRGRGSDETDDLVGDRYCDSHVWCFECGAGDHADAGDCGRGVDAAPVAAWSTEARRAIVPAGPGGIFGPENYGNKFPGEAAVYMGIVHAAIYDAAVAIEGGYKPYAIKLKAPPETSPGAAIATAAHDTLVGLQPQLGLTPAQQAILDGDYAAYLGDIPDGEAKAHGIRVGQKVAAAVLALRMQRRPREEPDARRPRSTRGGPWCLGSGLGSGAGSAAARNAAARAQERLAVPAGRAVLLDERRVREGLRPGQGARALRQHDEDRRRDH